MRRLFLRVGGLTRRDLRWREAGTFLGRTAVYLGARWPLKDEIDREVLMLRHFEDLSNKDVALVLGIQENAASNRYVRALGRLKGCLGSIGEL